VLYESLFGLGIITVLADLEWEGQYSKLMQTLAVKTLNLTVEYTFQLEAYIQHLISLCSLLEDPVKIFSKVILEERCQQDFE